MTPFALGIDETSAQAEERIEKMLAFSANWQPRHDAHVQAAGKLDTETLVELCEQAEIKRREGITI